MRPTESAFAREALNSTCSLKNSSMAYTMAEVREKFWIPKLRQLIKRVIFRCYGCKRFRAAACPVPEVGDLPLDRISGSRQFQVIGIDFVGPFNLHKEREARRENLLSCVQFSLRERYTWTSCRKDQSLEEFLITANSLLVGGDQKRFIQTIFLCL